jgi:hypothetical protein
LQKKECVDFHRIFFIECDCLFSPEANHTRELVDSYCVAYADRLEAIAAHYQALQDPQFTAVIQPFGLGTDLATLPLDFLSTLDCFHPSVIAHQSMAVALWYELCFSLLLTSKSGTTCLRRAARRRRRWIPPTRRCVQRRRPGCTSARVGATANRDAAYIAAKAHGWPWEPAHWQDPWVASSSSRRIPPPPHRRCRLLLGQLLGRE